MSCSTCSNPIDVVAEAITCGNCKKSFHPTPCSSLIESSWKAMSSRNKADWRCNACRRIRTRADEDDGSDSSINKRYRTEEISSMRTFKKEITNKIDEMAFKFEGLLDEMKKMLNQTNTSHLALSKKIEELVAECQVKDKKIDMLETRINYLEQKHLENNAVVVNAPTLKPPIETVIDIAKAAELNISPSDIIDAYRTKDHKKIIVKFANKNSKVLLMKKVRERKITQNNLGYSSNSNSNNTNSNNKIYVNEELTRLNRHLFWLAKCKARETNWKFVWVKEGRILAKKNEGDRPIYICSIADISFANSTV